LGGPSRFTGKAHAMTSSLPRRIYKKHETERMRILPLKVDFANGYPAGTAMFYHCLDCDDFVPSLPGESMGCQCHNVFIDTDAGRLSVKNDRRVMFVELHDPG
jgi:hypothetical protein